MKNSMKKLSILLAFSFIGCGGENFPPRDELLLSPRDYDILDTDIYVSDFSDASHDLGTNNNSGDGRDWLDECRADWPETWSPRESTNWHMWTFIRAADDCSPRIPKSEWPDWECCRYDLEASGLIEEEPFCWWIACLNLDRSCAPLDPILTNCPD